MAVAGSCGRLPRRHRRATIVHQVQDGLREMDAIARADSDLAQNACIYQACDVRRGRCRRDSEQLCRLPMEVAGRAKRESTSLSRRADDRANWSRAYHAARRASSASTRRSASSALSTTLSRKKRSQPPQSPVVLTASSRSLYSPRRCSWRASHRIVATIQGNGARRRIGDECHRPLEGRDEAPRTNVREDSDLHAVV